MTMLEGDTRRRFAGHEKMLTITIQGHLATSIGVQLILALLCMPVYLCDVQTRKEP